VDCRKAPCRHAAGRLPSENWQRVGQGGGRRDHGAAFLALRGDARWPSCCRCLWRAHIGALGHGCRAILSNCRHRRSLNRATELVWFAIGLSGMDRVSECTGRGVCEVSVRVGLAICGRRVALTLAMPTADECLIGTLKGRCWIISISTGGVGDCCEALVIGHRALAALRGLCADDLGRGLGTYRRGARTSSKRFPGVNTTLDEAQFTRGRAGRAAAARLVVHRHVSRLRTTALCGARCLDRRTVWHLITASICLEKVRGGRTGRFRYWTSKVGSAAFMKDLAQTQQRLPQALT